MDTADTAAPDEDCGIVPGMRLWIYHGISLDRCYIPVGAILSVPYTQKESSVEPTVEVPPVADHAPAVSENTELVSDPAPATPSVTPEAHVGVTPPQPSSEDLVKIASSETGTNGLLLALLAVAGSAGALKLYSDWSKQRHELNMKKVDVEAELRRDEKGLNGAQPPPCQAAQAKVEAELAVLKQHATEVEARLAKSEKALTAVAGADVDEMKDDVERIKKTVERLEKTLKAKTRTPAK